MSRTDRLINARFAVEQATRILTNDYRETPDLTEEWYVEHGQLADAINEMTWLVSGIPDDQRDATDHPAPARPAAGAPAAAEAPAAPDTQTWDALADPIKGALITAMSQLTDNDLEPNASKDEFRWSDCLYWNPDNWYDNRGDKKSPGFPDFRHKQIKDGNDRGIGLWLHGKAPAPEWVHTLLPFRDQPAVLAAALAHTEDEQPF